MNTKKLYNLLSLGEGFTVEFKEGGTSKIGRELCAFANATGGRVFIGVTDDGNINGISGHNKLKSIVQSIAHSIEPLLIVDIESVEEVLVITVPEQNSKPYSFEGKFYLREGASSQQLGRDEIRNFFFKEGLIHFDEMSCDYFVLDSHLLKDSFHIFAKRAKIPSELDSIQALENLHLIRNQKMTNAGAWLLSEDIRNVSSSAHISCALFQGRSKIKILDRKDFSQDLYTNFQDTISYLQSKLNTEFIITGTGRDEKLELPVDALREALVNGLAHRDYRSTANVQIHIFQDRVEIISPGGLPAGMKKENLGKKSIPRNQENTQPAENSVTPQVIPQVIRLLKLLKQPMGRRELQTGLGLKDREHFRRTYLQPALKNGLIVMSNPDKPRAADQKYRITDRGVSYIIEAQEDES